MGVTEEDTEDIDDHEPRLSREETAEIDEHDPEVTDDEATEIQKFQPLQRRRDSAKR